MVGSPLFGVSFAITALSYSNWLHTHWVDQTLALIPSLLGFSLGTYAILFSLLTNRMKRALRASVNKRGVTYLKEINATFLHFIFVQIASLFWAFLFSGTWLIDLATALGSTVPVVESVYLGAKVVGSFIGMLLLVYSIALVAGSALAVYRLAGIVDPKED